MVVSFGSLGCAVEEIPAISPRSPNFRLLPNPDRPPQLTHLHHHHVDRPRRSKTTSALPPIRPHKTTMGPSIA
jgi:hypothetical protein